RSPFLDFLAHDDKSAIIIVESLENISSGSLHVDDDCTIINGSGNKPIAATARGAKVENLCDRPLTNRLILPSRSCPELKTTRSTLLLKRLRLSASSISRVVPGLS